MFLGRSLAAMIRKWLTNPQKSDSTIRRARWRRAGRAISSTIAAARRTRCALMSRRRIASSTSSAAIAARRSSRRTLLEVSRGRPARIPCAAARRGARRLFGRARAFRRSRLPQICSRAGRAAMRSCRGRARPSGRAPCRAQPRPTKRSSLPRTPPRPRARRGSVRAISRSCCCSMVPGLRVAEALSLTARRLPIGATLRVTGKRSKTRVVPVVPAVREAIEDYVRQCPYPLSGDAPLFVGARGGPLNPDLVRRSVAAARRRLGPARYPDAACAAAQLRDPLARAGSGLALAAGIARPCEPFFDANLYGGGRGAPARRLPPRPPPRLSRGSSIWVNQVRRSASVSGETDGRCGSAELESAR